MCMVDKSYIYSIHIDIYISVYLALVHDVPGHGALVHDLAGHGALLHDDVPGHGALVHDVPGHGARPSPR